MSNSVNMVVLAGNVGKDAEIRTLDNGVKVASFSLATSEGGYTTKEGKEVPEKTQWHSVVAWRNLASLAEKVAKKGEKLTIIGSISYREYEKDGVKKYATDIIAEKIAYKNMEWTTNSNTADFGEPEPQKPNEALPF